MRCITVIIDSFGIGAAPDADFYGDSGANTALHIAERVPGPKWPALRAMGLGNCSLLVGGDLPGCGDVIAPEASYGVLKPASPGKDTTTGHWEIAGLILEKPFFTFPADYPSFPAELVADFEKGTGRKILGNRAASGTEIIRDLGEEHLRTGNPICYTSADSVFQVAAHEEIIPLEELYEICETARRLCDPLGVSRVIARPFTGKAGAFTRTAGRRDFSISLPGPTILNRLQESGVHTVGVGKIGNIFNESGLDESPHDTGNPACLARTIEILRRPPRSGGEFVFVNLVDTDMIFGHRRDPEGYCGAVGLVDEGIFRIRELLGEDDLFIISADHGCDPTFPGTDHTREFVPLLACRRGLKGGPLGIRDTFADVAATAADFFGLPPVGAGVSFLSELEGHRRNSP
jgi:phosphopentomutase